MSARATVAHQIPGRTRFLIAGERGNAGFFDQLSQRFSGVEGIRRVRANPTAGTLVLEYDGSMDEVMQRSHTQDLVELVPQHAGAAVMRPIMAFAPGKPVSLVSGRELDPMFMAGTAFGGIALVQALRGQVFVPAATAFWYAISIFQQSRIVKLEEAGTGIKQT